MPDVRSILGHHFMLKHLPPSELDRLASFVSARQCRAGERIFVKGDPGTAMMAVLGGRVRICSNSSDGREVLLNVIRPGEVFGEIALIDGGPRTADASAMEPTELLVLHRRDFLPFMVRNPEVCVRLLEVMCRRLRWTSQQVEDLIFLTLRSKLAKRLLMLWEMEIGHPRGRDGRRRLQVSQQTLADMIANTREPTNRQLRVWEQEGIIEMGRGWITVIKPQALRHIVDEAIGEAEAEDLR